MIAWSRFIRFHDFNFTALPISPHIKQTHKIPTDSLIQNITLVITILPTFQVDFIIQTFTSIPFTSKFNPTRPLKYNLPISDYNHILVQTDPFDGGSVQDSDHVSISKYLYNVAIVSSSGGEVEVADEREVVLARPADL